LKKGTKSPVKYAAIEGLYESLQDFRQVFLSHITAEVYRNERDQWGPGDWWAADSDTLEDENHQINRHNEAIDRGSIEGEKRSPMTAEEFGERLLNAFEYPGRNWEVLKTRFLKMHEGPEGSIVSTQWRVASAKAARHLQQAAQKVLEELPAAATEASNAQLRPHIWFKDNVIPVLQPDGHQWTMRIVPWTYLRDLDKLVLEVWGVTHGLRGEEFAAIDPSAFIPAYRVLDLWDHGSGIKQLKKVLKDNSQIRTRKPTRQRLEIHAGDWMRFQLRNNIDRDDVDPASEIRARVANAESFRNASKR